MPVFKNESNGTWYVMARYVNWKGERKQKCKRGFSTKKEAQEWERMFQLQNSSGASGDTELFEKASNINGFQGGRVANNLYISPFRATVFKTAALFLYLNSSVVIRVRKPLFFPL